MRVNVKVTGKDQLGVIVHGCDRCPVLVSPDELWRVQLHRVRTTIDVDVCDTCRLELFPSSKDYQ